MSRSDTVKPLSTNSDPLVVPDMDPEFFSRQRVRLGRNSKLGGSQELDLARETAPSSSGPLSLASTDWGFSWKVLVLLLRCKRFFGGSDRLVNF